jgi:beta-phosphoglucomutase-like phosphatase (HAD superfamily)
MTKEETLADIQRSIHAAVRDMKHAHENNDWVFYNEASARKRAFDRSFKLIEQIDPDPGVQKVIDWAKGESGFGSMSGSIIADMILEMLGPELTGR